MRKILAGSLGAKQIQAERGLPWFSLVSALKMSKNGEMEMASFGCVWEWVVIGSVRRRLEAKKFKTSLGKGLQR